LKRGEEQRSKELLCDCNGGEFVYCPAAKRELQWCFFHGLQCTHEQSFAVEYLKGIFVGAFLCLLMVDYLEVFYALEIIRRMIWNSL
jgi:hypothetical protein